MKKLSVLFFICCYTLVLSQHNENKDAYVLFDAIIGQKNLEINVGLKYIEKYRTLKNEHQFYLDKKLTKGTVTFNNQIYYNVPLMYDVYQDALITSISATYDSYYLILDKKKVSSFKLAQASFNRIEGKGYLQVLSASANSILYKKNKKKRKSRFVNLSKLSKFIPINSFYIYKDTSFYKVQKKFDWIALYPSHKSSIQLFFRANKSMLQNDPDNFMKALFKTVNN